MAKSIPTLTFNDGNKAPWVAYGTGTALYGRSVKDEVIMAINAGMRHLDGAQMYNNEDSLGDAIVASGQPRSELFITTKLAKLETSPGQFKTVEESLKESLAKLKVDYVDLFLIHVPTFHQQHEGRLVEVWKGMLEVKKAGLAKSVGVSNFNANQLEEIITATGEAPAVNQIEYHPFLLARAQPLIDFHGKHKIITASYGGLSPILPNRSSKPELEDGKKAFIHVVDKIRAKHDNKISQNQVLLKWLQQKGVLAVTTSTKESRIKEYLETSYLPDLTAEDLKDFETEAYNNHLRAFGTFSHMDNLK